MASTVKSSAKTPTAAKKKPGATEKSAVTKKPAAIGKTAASRQTMAAPPPTEFKLFAPEAKEVTLVGDFSNWQESECPMRRAKDGNWKKLVQLNPGRYEYRFVVDGHWWTDPENPDRQQNPYGQDNSVLVVP